MAKRARKASKTAAASKAAAKKKMIAALKSPKKAKKTGTASSKKIDWDAFGPSFTDPDTGWKVVYADVSLALRVHPDDAKTAMSGVTGNCPLAMALARSGIGQYITSAEVGTTVSKVWCAEEKVEVRFGTPKVLVDAIRVWDRSKGKTWPLAAGVYYTNRYPESFRHGYKSGRITRPYKSPSSRAEPLRRVPDMRAVYNYAKAKGQL